MFFDCFDVWVNRDSPVRQLVVSPVCWLKLSETFGLSHKRLYLLTGAGAACDALAGAR
nr:hypothetical protein [Acinetobacter haemolyticus]